MIGRPNVNRREMIGISAAVVGNALIAGAVAQEKKEEAPVKSEPRYKKAVKIGMVDVQGTLKDKFKLMKSLGFDGVELNAPSDLSASEVQDASAETGLPVHGVVDSVHWNQPLSDPDPMVRYNGLRALEQALKDSKEFGGTTVLLVPAVVKKDVSYADAYERSQKEIRKVLPLAKELNIRIGLENVWNNFLLSPLEVARYLDELESDMVGAYFDVGNVLRYGWPEHWIRTLGKRIVKLDIKEFSLKKQQEQGLYKGFDVELLEGDCDWPAVMAALREIDYSGWGTAEIPGGGKDRLMEIATRMDRIFAS